MRNVFLGTRHEGRRPSFSKTKPEKVGHPQKKSKSLCDTKAVPPAAHKGEPGIDGEPRAKYEGLARHV